MRVLKHKISIKNIEDKKIEKLYDTMEYTSFYSYTLRKTI